MAASGDVFPDAAKLIEEIRSEYRCQPNCDPEETGLEDLINELEESLREGLFEANETGEAALSEIENAVGTIKLASESASRISRRISDHRDLLAEARQQQLLKTLRRAEDRQKEFIVQLENECIETKERMHADLEAVHQAKLILDEESKRRAAELTTVHCRNLSSLRDSFHSAMQQLEGEKDHTLCQLRLKSLETKGRQTIERLETEIGSVRDEIKETRKLVSKRAREPLLSACQESLKMLTTKRRMKTSASARNAVGSVNETESEESVKRPRRKLFREKEEEQPRVGEGSVVATLEGEQLEAYLQSLRKLVEEDRGRRSRGAVVPRAPI